LLSGSGSLCFCVLCEVFAYFAVRLENTSKTAKIAKPDGKVSQRKFSSVSKLMHYLLSAMFAITFGLVFLFRARIYSLQHARLLTFKLLAPYFHMRNISFCDFPYFLRFPCFRQFVLCLGY
jgi:hypothetical protein